MFRRLDFLGRWKWPNIVAISVVPVAAYFLSWAPQNEPRPFGVTIFGPERIGPWVVVVGANDRFDVRQGNEVTLNIRFCAGCYEHIRRASLAFGDAHGPKEPEKPIVGNPNSLHASMPIPETVQTSDLYLWVMAEEWNGARHRASWKVAAEVI